MTISLRGLLLNPTSVLLCALLLAPAALAAPATMAERAKAYAEKHNLPIREVPIDVGGRKEVRIFVPVTDATHADFMKEFTEDGAVIRQAQDIEHVQLATSPDTAFHYGTQMGGVWGAPVEGPGAVLPNQGGRYVALGLDAETKAHLKQNLGTPPDGARKGGCMWWLVHAKVSPNQPLAHAMGVKQSAAPSNLIKKLVHAGNDKVVVGVSMSEMPGQVQNLRNQLVNFDRNIQAIQAQITNLEAQGGNRIRQYESQAAPLRQAIAQLEVTVEQRKGQPAIAAALQAKLDGYKQSLATLTQQHEAPYNQRLAQLDQAIAGGKATLAQRQAAFDPNLKAARDTLALREHDRDELVRFGPSAGNPNARFEHKLAELDQGIKQLQTQADQGKPQREAQRNQARTTIANGENQVKDAMQRWPNLPANAANEGRYNQRIAQLDQQLAQQQNTINAFAAQPAQKVNVNNARAVVDQLTTIKNELLRHGPKNFDVLFDSMLGKATWVVAQGKMQLAQVDLQEEQQTAQIAKTQQDRATLAQRGAANFHPEYDAEIARLDQVIAQNKAQLAQYQANPAYANQFRAQLAANEQAKANLAAVRPEDYNPQYQQRMAQLDQAINQVQAQLNQYGALPQYAPHVVTWRAQLDQNQKAKADLVRGGPHGYDPQYEQKVTVANQTVDQARAQVEGIAVQRDAPAQEIARNEALRAELQKRGSLQYNPAYEQRLLQIDQQAAQLEGQIRQYPSAQYAQSRVQWQAQIDQNRKIRDELVAKGPADYFANEPQIQQLKAQLVQIDTQSAPLRLQLQTAEAMAAGGNQVAEKFAAIPDQTLLGAPPGGEAILR